MSKRSKTDNRLVIVTGPSGAGRSTAVHALEDLGFEAIDNLPLSLLHKLFEVSPLDHPLALGVDVRNRDFSVDRLIEVLDQTANESGVELDLLYLDCTADILVRRFSETRRPHPLSPAASPLEGVLREIELLAPIRDRASVLIDTSDLTPHDLRAEIEDWFGTPDQSRMIVSVQSFSYKRGIPRGVDLVFDVRFLANPHWEPQLRALNGLDPSVSDFVAKDPRFEEFWTKIGDLIRFLLPAYEAEGKSHIAIAFGCTGGQHRSVALAEMLAISLEESGWQVSKRHREMERRSPAGQTGGPAKVEGRA